MTYPPQGPYGQQPPGANGPYGGQGGQQGGYQQGGHQQGGHQQGGFQQGGPPQGGYPTPWGQPQGGQQNPYGAPGPYGQPGQYGGPAQPGGPQFGGPQFDGQQPPKKKTGLIVGVGVAVLVVAALLFTGFVAPGFFRSDGSPQATGGAGGSEPVGGSGKEIPTQQSLPTDVPTTEGGGGTGGGPDEAGFLVFAQSAVDALNTRNFDKIIAITCDKPSAQEADKEKRRLAESDVRATITGSPTVTGNTGSVDIQLVTGGRSEKSNLDGTYIDGAWCGGDPE